MVFLALVTAALAARVDSFEVTVRVAGPETVVLVRASKWAPLLLFCHKPAKKRPQL
jgi:hypothetical protein